MTLKPLALTLAALIGLVACGAQPGSEDSTPADRQAGNQTATSALPEGLLLAQPPAGALPLHQARAEAVAGQPIVFTGYIGGRTDPFVEGRALFIVADAEKAPACVDDGCPTPWDACCVPGETITANSATVRVVDNEGRILPLDLRGREGLEPGARVAVVGEVAQADANALIVNAQGIAAQTAAE